MATSPDEEFNEQLLVVVNSFKQKTVLGSFDIAMRTALLLRKLIGIKQWNNVTELVTSVKSVGKQLMSCDPSQISVGNIIRRVLKLIREEHTGSVGKDNDGESLQTLVISNSVANQKDSTSHVITAQNLKSAVLDAINELIMELENCRDNIAMQAMEYIHSNEIIMTFGKSRTVERFLKRAARSRKFTVVIAECAPLFKGQELALSLSDSEIETIVIPDSAVFAVMSRVNKVIVGSHAVMADGGLKANNGAQSIALAAKQHSVPFIVCAGLFKLSPTYVYNDENQFSSPDDVLKFKIGKLVSQVSVYNPTFDYISAYLVTLFISDVGGNSPSYLYRLLAELYHQQDYIL